MPESGNIHLVWDCAICEKTSRRKQNLRDHITRKHKITDDIDSHITSRKETDIVITAKKIPIITKKTPVLIDIADKNVQIQAQLRDIYTQIDKIDTLEIDTTNRYDTITNEINKLKTKINIIETNMKKPKIYTKPITKCLL